MGTIAVIGEEPIVSGYALAGATVLIADTPEQARSAWNRLPEDVDVVILTAGAAAADPGRATGERPLVVVMR